MQVSALYLVDTTHIAKKCLAPWDKIFANHAQNSAPDGRKKHQYVSMHIASTQVKLLSTSKILKFICKFSVLDFYEK